MKLCPLEGGRDYNIITTLTNVFMKTF